MYLAIWLRFHIIGFLRILYITHVVYSIAVFYVVIGLYIFLLSYLFFILCLSQLVCTVLWLDTPLLFFYLCMLLLDSKIESLWAGIFGIKLSP